MKWLQGLYSGISATVTSQQVFSETDLVQLTALTQQQQYKYQLLKEQVQRLENTAASTAWTEDADQLSTGQAEHVQSRHKLAVIVPYRDREAHLQRLLLQLDAYLTVFL